MERIFGNTETVTVGVSLFLVHFGPENAVNGNAFGSDSSDELFGVNAVFEFVGIEDEGP